MKEAAVRHYDLINSFASFNITGYFHEIFIENCHVALFVKAFPSLILEVPQITLFIFLIKILIQRCLSKLFFEKFCKVPRKTTELETISIRLQAVEKGSHLRWFAGNFARFLRTAILKITHGWLCLYL